MRVFSRHTLFIAIVIVVVCCAFFVKASSDLTTCVGAAPGDVKTLSCDDGYRISSVDAYQGDPFANIVTCSSIGTSCLNCTFPLCVGDESCNITVGSGGSCGSSSCTPENPVLWIVRFTCSLNTAPVLTNLDQDQWLFTALGQFVEVASAGTIPNPANSGDVTVSFWMGLTTPDLSFLTLPAWILGSQEGHWGFGLSSDLTLTVVYQGLLWDTKFALFEPAVSHGYLNPIKTFVAAVFTPGLTCELYVNGVSMASTTFPAQSPSFTTSTILIGEKPELADFPYGFSGYIDSLKIFPAVLTDADVAAVMANTYSGTIPQAWLFDGNLLGSGGAPNAALGYTGTYYTSSYEPVPVSTFIQLDGAIGAPADVWLAADDAETPSELSAVILSTALPIFDLSNAVLDQSSDPITLNTPLANLTVKYQFTSSPTYLRPDCPTDRILYQVQDPSGLRSDRSEFFSFSANNYNFALPSSRDITSSVEDHDGPTVITLAPFDPDYYYALRVGDADDPSPGSAIFNFSGIPFADGYVGFWFSPGVTQPSSAYTILNLCNGIIQEMHFGMTASGVLQLIYKASTANSTGGFQFNHNHWYYVSASVSAGNTVLNIDGVTHDTIAASGATAVDSLTVGSHTCAAGDATAPQGFKIHDVRVVAAGVVIPPPTSDLTSGFPANSIVVSFNQYSGTPVCATGCTSAITSGVVAWGQKNEPSCAVPILRPVITSLPTKGWLFSTTDGVSMITNITSASVPFPITDSKFRVLYVPTPGLGPSTYLDSFTYGAQDQTNSSLTPSTVTVNVTLSGNQPVVITGNVTILQDTDALLTFNFSDIDFSEVRVVTITQAPSRGLLQTVSPVADITTYPFNLSSPYTATFHPDTGEFGSPYSRITFSVIDAVGLTSNLGVYNIFVTKGADSPQAFNISAVVELSASVGILLNGFSPQGNDIDFYIVELPSSGTLKYGPTGLNATLATPYDTNSFVYTAASSPTAIITFSYMVRSGVINSSTAYVTINVTNFNAPPSPEDQTLSLLEDASIVLQLSGTDVETPPSALQFYLLSLPEHGHLTNSSQPLSQEVLIGTGDITYTPVQDYNGLDQFSFLVFDGFKFSVTYGTVVLNVTAVDDFARADPQFLTFLEESTNNLITFTGHDPDEPSAPLEFETSACIGLIGVLSPNCPSTSPAVNYSPQPYQTGADSFNVSATSLLNLKTNGPATISITLIPVNHAPLTQPIVVNVIEDIPQVFSISAFVSDLETRYRIQVESAPTNGQLYWNTPAFELITDYPFMVPGTSDSAIELVYVGDSPGVDSILYTAIDEGGFGFPILESTNQVNFNIAALNLPPVPNDQTLWVNEDTVLNITLSANDPDDPDPTLFEILSLPSLGTLGDTSVCGGLPAIFPASIYYCPPGNAHGPPNPLDSFTFVAQGGTIYGTVYITVLPQNDPPVATPAGPFAAYQYSVLPFNLSGTDIDSSDLVCIVSTAPGLGDLFLDSQATAPYSPGSPLSAPCTLYYLNKNGQPSCSPHNSCFLPDVLTFFVQDPQGSPSSPIDVAINLFGVDLPPVALQTRVVHPNINPGSFSFVLNATDPDSPISTAYAVIQSLPPFGILYACSDSSCGLTILVGPLPFTTPTLHLVYFPALNEVGISSFEFAVVDEEGLVSISNASVIIEITAVDRPPTAFNSVVSVPVDTELTIFLNATDDFTPDHLLVFQVTSLDFGPPGYLYQTNTSFLNLQSVTPPEVVVTLNRLYFRASAVSIYSFTFVAFDRDTLNDGSLDIQNQSNTATFTISVTPVNQAPLINSQVANVFLPEDAVFFPVDMSSLVTDTDPLTYFLHYWPTGSGDFSFNNSVEGVFTLMAPPIIFSNSSTFYYSPPPNENVDTMGVLEVRFSADDNSSSSETGIIHILVTPVNDPPTSMDFNVTLQEDQTIAIEFLGNDIDGDPLQYNVTSLDFLNRFFVSQVDGGRPATLLNSSPLSWTLFQTNSFSTICDPLSPINFNPFTLYYADEIADLPPASPLPFSLTYYVVDPSCAASAQSTVYIERVAANDPPVAYGFVVLTDATQPSFTIPLNGTDKETPEGSLQRCITTEPYDPTGSATNPGNLTDGGSLSPIVVDTMPCKLIIEDYVTFTPTFGGFGSDGNPYAVFKWQMYDGQAYSPPVEVLIYIAGANNNPVAVSQNLTADENVPYTWWPFDPANPALTDVDKSTTKLIVAITSLPFRGKLYQCVVPGIPAAEITMVPTNLTFPYMLYVQNVPNEYDFWDNWTWFGIDNTNLVSQEVIANLFVRFVNQPPVAVSNSIPLLEGDPNGATFILGDKVTDIEGDTLYLYILSLPGTGTLTADGLLLTCAGCTCGTVNCTYPPIPISNINATFNFNAFTNVPITTPFASIQWYVFDGTNNSNVAFQNIDLTKNTPPTASALDYYTLENTRILIVLNGTDAETPDGQLIPFITNSPLRGNLTQYDGTPIITCLDGCGIRIAVTDPQHRVWFVGSLYDASTYEMQGNVSVLVSYSTFGFQVDDSTNLQFGLSSPTAFITIFVIPVFDPPLSRNDSVVMRERNSKTINLYGFNPQSGPMTFRVLSLPSEGLLYQTLNGITPIDANVALTEADLPAVVRSTSHQLIYTSPRVDSWLDATFLFSYDILTYNGTDNTSSVFYSTPGYITITVRPVNQAPLANDQILYMNEDANITITLTGRDPNTLDVSVLSAVISTLPSKGALYQYPANGTVASFESLDRIVTPFTTVTDRADQHNNWRLLYIPATNDNGVPYTSFQYFINDLKTDSFPGRITINVFAVNDPPTPGSLLTQNAIAGSDLILSIGGVDPDISTGGDTLQGFIVDPNPTSLVQSGSALYQIAPSKLRDDPLNFTAQVTRGDLITENCTMLSDASRRVILAPNIQPGNERSTLKLPVQFFDGILWSSVAEINILVTKVKTELPGSYSADTGTWVGPLIAAAATFISLMAIMFIIWWRNTQGGDDEEYSPNFFDVEDHNDDEDAAELQGDIDVKPRGPVERLLLDPKYQILSALLNAIDVTEYDAIAKSLVDIFEYHECTLAMLKHFITLEVESASSAGTLFRANSIASKMMTAYTKMMGVEYLIMTLKVPIETIIKKDSALEVDPKKIKSGESRKANVRLLNLACQNFLDWIVSSSENAPVPFKILSNHLFNEVAKRFPTNKHIAVGGFLFLRYFCPAIISPEGFKVLPEAPPPAARRALVLIAKVLQNLANGVLFGKKEEYMLDCNDFIQRNTETVKTYFDSMVSIGYNAGNPPCVEIAPERLASALTVIQRYLYDGQVKIIDILEGKDGTHSERTDSHSTSRSGRSRSSRPSGSKGSTRDSSKGNSRGSSKGSSIGGSSGRSSGKGSRQDRSGSRSGSLNQPAFGEDSVTDVSDGSSIDEYEPLDEGATKDLLFVDDDGAEYVLADDRMSDEDEILFDEDTIPGEEFSVEEVGTETARRMGMQVEDWTNVDDLSLDDIWEKEAPQMEDIHRGFNAAGEIVDPVLAFKTVMATIGSPDD